MNGPRRLLVVLDVDSTLIEQEVVDLIADASGHGEQVAALTAAAMRGEIDFAESLRRRVALLAGLDVAVLGVLRERITVTDGVPELIAAVHAAGGAVAAVSGGFSEVLDPLGRELGLDAWRANRLEVRQGRLTGELDGPAVDAEAKRRTLEELARRFRVPMSRTIAIGDGANDLRMLAVAGLAVAFDAKPAVRAAAHIVLPGRSMRPVLPLLGLG